MTFRFTAARIKIVRLYLFPTILYLFQHHGFMVATNRDFFLIKVFILIWFDKQKLNMLQVLRRSFLVVG